MVHNASQIRFFDHTGDIGMEVFAPSLPEIFKTAAAGMFSILTESRTIHPHLTKTISLKAEVADELLILWLNRLLFLFDTEGWLFSQFEITLPNEKSLQAVVRGERYDPERHEILREIKAATYHRLTLEKRENTWYARVIFDL